MSLVFSLLVLAAFILAGFHYWKELASHESSQPERSFWFWVLQGVCVPALLWMLFNSGLFMPPLMPQLEIAAPPGGSRFSVWLHLTAIALMVIASYWGAITFVWLTALIRARAGDRKEFHGYCLFWSVLTLPVALMILYFAHGGWAGLAVVIWLWPIVHTTVALAMPRKVYPLYSRAIAKMKFGKYNEAEWEVIQELEKCQDDFDGWLMLAELYANHFHDLPVAEQTIHDTCHQPNITPSQIAVAFHRLADWQLKVGNDPIAARRALEEICRRLPATHLERMARMRLNQLPATKEELHERRQSRPIHLPPLSDSLNEIENKSAREVSRGEAAAQANRCVEKLTRDPDHVVAREELARIFAEQLEQVDLGIEQIQLLLEMPDQPVRKRAEWWALLAAWQLRYRRDAESTRKILERLTREFPDSAQAFAAQRRLNLMEMELRMRQAGLARDGSR